MEWIFIAILTICTLGYFFYNRKKKKKIVLSPKNTSTITIEGELLFSDVISYLKNCNLKKGEDIPFVYRKSERADEIFGVYSPQFELAGYQWLLIGVFNEAKNEISECKVIYVKSFDSRLEELLLNEDLVVLE